ncbi:FG-GAP repeat domain-containing protein [Streptomyces sp. NPDC088116]|uniref:FG-GAP repeat domain-containing protein n=1 Tax=Streptomyces sp. NPDC088116 TaxID=3365825 RepID=UPI0037F5E40D
MKRRHHLVALAGLTSVAVLTTGCSGGDEHGAAIPPKDCRSLPDAPVSPGPGTPVGKVPTATDPRGTDPRATDPTHADPRGTAAPRPTDPTTTAPTGADPTGVDPTDTDPTDTDPTDTDPTGTDPTGTASMYEAQNTDDINGDGYPDLSADGWYRPVSGGGWQRNRAIAFGSASGIDPAKGLSLTRRYPALGPSASAEGPAGHGAGAQLRADVNADGFADILIPADPALPGDRSRIVWGGPKGTDGTAELPARTPPLELMADFDGDGSPDLLAEPTVRAVADDSAQNQCATLLRGPFTHDGRPRDVSRVDLSVGGLVQKREMRTGDFDGDGRDDLVVTGVKGAPDPYDEADGKPAADHTEFYRGTDEGLARVGELKGFPTRIGTSGDFDGDGRDDLVAGAYVHFGGRDGLADARREPSKLPGGLGVRPVGDVNGDGREDLVDVDRGGPRPDGAVTVYLGGPEGLEAQDSSPFSRASLWPPRTSGHDGFGRDIQLTDLDRDGCDDLVVGHLDYDKSGGENGYWILRGSPRGVTAEGARFVKAADIGGGGGRLRPVEAD